MSAPCYPCPRPDIRWCPCQVSGVPSVMPGHGHRAPTNGITSLLISYCSFYKQCLECKLELFYSAQRRPLYLSTKIITDGRFGQQGFLKPPDVDSSSSYSKQSGEYRLQTSVRVERRRYGGGRWWWQGAARCGQEMQTADTLDTGGWPPAPAPAPRSHQIPLYPGLDRSCFYRQYVRKGRV